MATATAKAKGGSERRTSERHSCKPHARCHVTEVLSQSPAEAGAWNVSSGGVCVLVVPHYTPGTRLSIELWNADEGRGLVAFGEVVYTVEVPSEREMWMIGCAFQGDPLREEELRPFAGN